MVLQAASPVGLFTFFTILSRYCLDSLPSSLSLFSVIFPRPSLSSSVVLFLCHVPQSVFSANFPVPQLCQLPQSLFSAIFPSPSSLPSSLVPFLCQLSCPSSLPSSLPLFSAIFPVPILCFLSCPSSLPSSQVLFLFSVFLSFHS